MCFRFSAGTVEEPLSPSPRLQLMYGAPYGCWQVTGVTLGFLKLNPAWPKQRAGSSWKSPFLERCMFFFDFGLRQAAEDQVLILQAQVLFQGHSVWVGTERRNVSDQECFSSVC